MNKAYENPYGTWRVTTEGDCEGRSTRQLGTFQGYIDEIALSLADKCNYSLHFSAVPPQEYNDFPKHSEVNVTLDIESGTWDAKPDERVERVSKIFKDRPVRIMRGSSFASFIIRAGKSEEESERLEKEIAIRKAKEKLTPAEQKLLGLE